MSNFNKIVTVKHLDKYQQIYSESQEWSSIYLGNAAAQLKKVYYVVNPQMHTSFEKQSKGMIVYESYVKPEELSGFNRMERVCQKGFQLDQNKGLEFTVGQIDLMPNQEEEHELLIVRLCPRKSYPCFTDEQTSKENFRGPNGFDSVYYKEQNGRQDIYRHKFRVFKKIQILPYYVVQFTFNKSGRKRSPNIKCQDCQEEKASIFCFHEKLYFCKSCDYHHHKDRLFADHERKELTNQKPIVSFGNCSQHPNNKNELFCKDCSRALCVSCKVYGDHLDGHMGTHSLEKIGDYYQATIQKIKDMDPNLDKRKDQFKELLVILDGKIKEINETTSNLQIQLTKMFKQAMASLQSISRRKISYLISDQLEIRRQYDYIQWMESFLKYEFNVLPPNEYLISWTKHIKLRKEVLSVSNIPTITEVTNDFKLNGKVQVEADGKIIFVASDEDQLEKYLETRKILDKKDPKMVTSGIEESEKNDSSKEMGKATLNYFL